MTWSYKEGLGEIQTVAQARDDARRWLFDVAAPLWSGNGTADNGMFAERIGLDGSAVPLHRRLRVQARQIYSFCAIGNLGWSGPWQEKVNHAVDILIGRGRGENGFFIHLFDDLGEVIDTRFDLYDHAFGLFALAHAGKSLGRTDLLEIAEAVQSQLETAYWRTEGGYWEGELTPCPPYRQNPHMHMFEAAVAHYNVTGADRWKARYQKIAKLFANRFFDQQSGAVTELFDVNWERLKGASGKVVEPGHCLEWAWLFEVAQDAGPSIALSDSLTGFARRYGISDVHGVAINEVSTNGEIVDAGARLWPQTERLKAALARWARLNSTDEAEEIVAAYNGLRLYFNTPVAGSWWDRLGPDGNFLEEAAPASSFYHIVCALSELLTSRP